MTRVLTIEEIEDILDFIKPNFNIPIESAIAIMEMTKDRFRNQLKNQKVYPTIIPELKKLIEKNYMESLIQPGESVGIIAAQSIGERQTQNTLNTFHRAGQSEKSVTVGVPRFQELLNATKAPKIVNCKIFFKEGASTVKELRETIASNLVCLTLKDFCLSSEIVIKKEPEEWYETFKLIYNDNFEKCTDCISIKLNSEVMFKYRVNIFNIVKIIEDHYDDLFCVFSPLNNQQLDIFVDTSNINFSEEKLMFIDPENVNEIYIEECVLPILNKMVICGIPGISNIYYTQENDEWYVETDGTNFRKLLGHPIIDMSRVLSNNVWDIFETLGIEAAREFLISEFLSIMEGINDCHVKLLVEKMTFNGTINSISRYTLRKDESGPLSRSSFEESVENFIRSAFSADVEKIKGVSASIICGKRAHMGTGMIDLKVDTKQLKYVNSLFKDDNNEGIVKEEKAITKIKPYVYKLK
jgi:DNA-directed RNA polymerase beta' subunit